jgi:hypothetical protein
MGGASFRGGAFHEPNLSQVTHPSGASSALAITDDELLDVERLVAAAVRKRSVDGLHVLGFGEAGLALAWPGDHPRLVLKRLLSTEEEGESRHLFELVERYRAAVEPFVAVAPTETRLITDDDGRCVPYMVQQLYPAEHLLENVLASDAPDPEHPALVALRDAALSALADGRQAIDSQPSNFAWEDETLVFFDIGTPFLYDESGPLLEFGAMLETMPAVLRPLVRREIGKVNGHLGTPFGNLEHAALGLIRIGQDRWLDAAVACFNERLDQPLDVATIATRGETFRSQLRFFKKVMRVQRMWVTKVRRRRYDFFITDSWTGEIL